MKQSELERDVNSTAERYKREANQMLRLGQILSRLPEEQLSEICYLGLSGEPFSVYLRESCPAPIARQIATNLVRITGVRGEKRLTYNKGAIFVVYKGEGIPTFSLYGYTPPTCRKVKMTRTIPAQPEQTIEYETIVCTDGEEGVVSDDE